MDRKAYNKAYYEKRKHDVTWLTEHRERCVKSAHDIRDQIITALGGKCIKCGFADQRALQIDHVNGGGHAERLLTTSRSSMYRNMLKDPEFLSKYQCLCANCNWIKRYENKEHGTGKANRWI